MPCALPIRSEEHTSELQSHDNLVCRLLLEKKKSHVQTRRRSVRGFCSAVRAGRGGRAPRSSPTTRLPSPGRRHLLSDPRTFFFFNDTATTEIYTLSVHDALPICSADEALPRLLTRLRPRLAIISVVAVSLDRKSTRLNSSHTIISYAVFCLKKKNKLSADWAAPRGPMIC